MHAENNRFRDFLGVTAWHKAGYTGKRGLTASGEDFLSAETGDHAYKTYAVFKEFAPDREVIYLPWFADEFIGQAIPQILERRVDTMFTSMTSHFDGSAFDTPMEDIIPFSTYFMGAGNSSDDDYNHNLLGKYVYGVGAYYLMVTSSSIVPTWYSSVADVLDFCAPTNIILDGGPFTGTSCAGPVLCAMAALVNDFFLEKTGKPLSSQMMYQFFKDNCRDIGDAGKDVKTGWGAVILPDPSTVDIERYAGEMLNSRDIGKLRADVAENCRKFIELCEESGYPVLVTGTIRDDEFQALCYYRGTGGKPPATFHSVKAGLAFDVCKIQDGVAIWNDDAFWNGIAAIAEKMGFTWGGHWTRVDKPHFQWDDYKKYSNADIIAGRYPPEMPLYKEEEEMISQDTFDKMYNAINPIYAKLENVPSYWQAETKALMDAGKLKGDGTGNLNIRHETLRAIIAASR